MHSTRTLKKKNKALLILLLNFILLTANTFATVYTVSSNADANTGSGTSGTLRWCINQLNADPSAGPHLIQFNIAGAGVQTITLTSSLPTLTKSNVTIDGYTQPGAAMGSFSGRLLMVQINGTVPAGYSLTILASNILFRGFDLNTANNDGYAFLSLGVRTGNANSYSNIKIQGCFFNASPTGGPLTPTPSYTITGAVHVHGTVTANNTPSSASNVIIGVDGDGIDDDKEGNLASCSTGSSGVVNLRDVDNCVVAGNWFGLQANGTSLLNYLPAGNTGTTNYPIYMGNDVSCRIGSDGNGISDDFERNIIADGLNGIYLTYNYSSGTNPSLSGMFLRAPGNNQITGNFIGTFADGITPTNRITNGGIILRGKGNYIGCNPSEITGTALRNVITAGQYAIYESSPGAAFPSSQSIIKGNIIGIANNNSSPIGTGYGVVTQSSTGTKIIGNTIGNMSQDGIIVLRNSAESITATNFTIQDNIIGLLQDKVTAAPNVKNGIEIASGQTGLIINNFVANNSLAGVAIKLTSSFKTQGIKISENSIWNNGGLGIDLWPSTGDGVTANDGNESAASSTTAPNLLMDYPVLTNTILNGNMLTISGYVGSVAGQALFANANVEFFVSNNTPSNQNGEIVAGDGLSVAHGEGQLYLGNIITGSDGQFSTTIDVTGKGIISTSVFTATATDAAGNTSEFGANFALVSYTVLPVKLTAFTAQYSDGKTSISWSASSEENIGSYSLQRSIDGSNFTDIQKVGAINSFVSHNYSAFDAAIPPNATVVYYRLRISEINSSFSFSNTVAIHPGNGIINIELFPNPATTYLTISFKSEKAGTAMLQLINAGGTVVDKKQLSVIRGSNSTQYYGITKLPAGIYLLQINNGNSLQSKNFIKN